MKNTSNVLVDENDDNSAKEGVGPEILHENQ